MLTLAVISAGIMAYCWKVALGFSNQPWNKLVCAHHQYAKARYHSDAWDSHLVAFRDVGHLCAHLLDDSCRLRAGDEGEVGDVDAVRLDLPVNGIQGGRYDLDKDILGSGCRNVGFSDFPAALLDGEDERLLRWHSGERLNDSDVGVTGPVLTRIGAHSAIYMTDPP